MSLNNNKDQNPDPPIRAKQATDFLIDLYGKAGQEISYEKAFKFASSSDFKSNLPNVYRHLYGADSVPDQKQIDSIYNGLLDPAYLEKKNQVQNVTEGLESASILEEKSTSSDYQPQGDKPLLRPEEGFYDILDGIDKYFFTLKPEQAKTKLEESMTKYGFKFDVEGFAVRGASQVASDPASVDTGATRLRITTPTGSSQSFRLFTPDYMAKFDDPSKAKELANVRLDRMKAFIKSNGNQAVDFVSDRMAAADSGQLKSIVAALFKDSDDRLSDEVSEIASQMPWKTDVEDYTDINFRTDRNKIISALKTIKKDLPNRTYKSIKDPFVDAKYAFFGQDKPEQYKHDPKVVDGVDNIISKVNKQIYSSSYTIGNLLASTGAYSKIDVNNLEDVMYYNNLGLMPEDIPLEAIKVNGRARSLNYLTNIVYDFDKVQQIKDGEIALEVADPSTAGVLSDLVVKARDMVDKQEAYRSKFFAVEGMRKLERTYDVVENFAQASALGLYELPVSLGFMYYDTLVGMGMDEKVADRLVYGYIGFPNFIGFRPEYLDKANEEWLPKWNEQYTDLNSVHELIAKGSVDMGRSMATSATFIANPALGLTVTGINAYSSDRRSFVDLQDQLAELKKSGVILTSEEENILSTSGLKSRGSSLLKAGLEVGFTSLFTYRYFKDVLKYRTLSPVIGETRDAVRNFANVYAKNHRDSFVRQAAQNFGVSARVLANEVPEEEFIAFSQYLTDVAFKYDDWSWEKAKKLAWNTGVSSAFTSYGMGVATNLSNNVRTRKIGESLIKSNITYGSELDLLVSKDRIEATKKVLEERAEQEKTDLSKDQGYQFVKESLSELDDKISRIDKEKENLVKQMSSGDKVAFLDLMAKIKRSRDVFDQDANPQAKKDIEKYKSEARNILAKYPNRLGFHYSAQSIQDLIRQKAFVDLKEEALSTGKPFSLTDQDPEVTDRAEDIYEKLILIGSGKKAINNSDIDPFFKDVFGDSEVVFKDGSLSALAENTFINNNVESTAIPFEVYGYVTAEGKKNAEGSFLAGLESNLSFLKQQRSEEDPNVVKSVAPELVSDAIIPSERVDRALAVVERLKGVNIDALMENLTDREKAILNRFELSVYNNEDVNFYEIENLTTAFEIINKIKAKSPGGIDLEGVQNEDGTITEKGAQLSNSLIQELFFAKGGMATKDVVARILFKDSEVGKPFLDLLQESFRSSAEAQNIVNEIYDRDLALYKESAGILNNPLSRDNSYEMSILAALKREVADDQESDISEFDRMKKLILRERDIRKEEYEQSKTDINYKRYKAWSNAIDKLNVEKAVSYSDVESRASRYNVEAVDRLAVSMPGQRAIDHIEQTTGREAFRFKEGTYVPLFMRKGDNSFSDFHNKFSGDVELSDFVPESFRENSRPMDLSDELRLNPEYFFENAYGSLRSMEMDILARKNFETLDLVLNSKNFRDVFAPGGIRNETLNQLKKIPGTFNFEVSRSKSRVINESSMGAQSTLNLATGAVYSTASSIGLVRIGQRPSQYFSAVAGVSPLIKNPEAQKYLFKRGAAFTTMTASLTSKNKSTFAVVDRIKEALGTGGTPISNIYRKSRTGLRNTTVQDVALARTKAMPISYYTTLFNLDEKQGIELAKALGGTAKYTFDGILNAISKSSELSLEIWLATADKIAASHSFEALYMDHRISQGAKIPSDSKGRKEWWLNEDKNPNLEAIRYADEKVVTRMRGAETSSEASVYNSTNQRALMRALFPFGRFQMNAKSDISVQLSILSDPSIPQDQKDEAEAVLKGRVAEVLSYNIMKYGISLSMVSGIAATFFNLTGGEEEDIERSGGMEGLIASEILPIDARDYEIDFKNSLDQAKTIEERDALIRANTGIREIEGLAREFHTYSMTFEDRFKTGKDYGIFGSTLQDLAITNNPLPIPPIFEDLLAIGINEMFGEGNDPMTEFLSRDIDRADTPEGQLKMLVENSGVAALGWEQYKALMRAISMSQDFEIKKYAGEIMSESVKEYVSAPNDIMKEQLVGATQMLMSLRFHSLLNPIAPRADLDRFADKLERSIETYFGGYKDPDPRMDQMRGEMVLPWGIRQAVPVVKPFKEPLEKAEPEKKEKPKVFTDTGGFGF